jgi:hypothetical protein
VTKASAPDPAVATTVPEPVVVGPEAAGTTPAVPIVNPDVPDLASLGFAAPAASNDEPRSHPGEPAVSLPGALGASVIGVGLLALLWTSTKRARLRYG